MSKSISVFCTGGVKLNEVVGAVSRSAGVQLVERSSEVGKHLFEGALHDIFVSVFDNHGLDDDCGIEFSKYHFEVDFTSSDSHPCAERLACAVANTLKELYPSEHVIVVNNLQSVIEQSDWKLAETTAHSN